MWDVPSGKQLAAIKYGYGYRSASEYVLFVSSPDWKTLFVSHRKQNLKRVEQAGKRATRMDSRRRRERLVSGHRQTGPHLQAFPPRAIVAINFLGIEGGAHYV